MIALNINFDSMRECLKLIGHPPEAGFRDVAFFQVMDRFLRLAAEYEAPLSIYVIGQDLEDPRNAEAVAGWQALGHEIGNHSYSHRQDLCSLTDDAVAEEIGRAHEMIKQTIGESPVGFIAPGWASSGNIVRALSALDYAYDTSLAPSWVLSVAQVALWRKSAGARDLISIIRPDWRGNLMGRRLPYRPDPANYLMPARNAGASDGSRLVMLPLPTVPGIRLGLWHTLTFAMGENLFDRLLRAAMYNRPTFYYLMHPLDLIDPEQDLDGLPASVAGIERLMVPYAQKERRMRRVLATMAARGRFVHMRTLAEHALKASGTQGETP